MSQVTNAMKTKNGFGGYRENDPMGGYDPYSASKGCSELVTAAYRNSFFHPDNYGKTHNILLASVRAGNVIGGGDWAEDRLVPDIMQAVSRGKEVIIRNPEATRPWQHVLEPLSGYLLLGKKLLEGKTEVSGPWNFGPGEEGVFSVRQIAEYIKYHWKTAQFTIRQHPENLHEARLLKLDCSKSNVLLKWKAVWNMETTAARTAEWYRQFYENQKVNSHSDLKQYIQDIKTSC